MKNYYELLELPVSATMEEVKKTFRIQIARYHPDKVHHLGQEFQEMAAVRAAELTEAYRVLSHEQRRAEYDATLKAATGATATAVSEAPPAAPPPPDSPAEGPVSNEARKSADVPRREGGSQFVQERARRDAFVRSAIIGRFRQALEQVAGNGYDEAPSRGFDISFAPKTKLFVRGKGPRLLGRFVPRVDADTVAEAWGLVSKLNLGAGENVCVMLMATDVAPARELAGAIAEQRRRPVKGVNVTVIPVNASIWDAHMPLDAPDMAKNLLTRLKAGS